MKHPAGYTHIVVVILISALALGLAGVAWWYGESDSGVTQTVKNANTNTENVDAQNINKSTKSTDLEDQKLVVFAPEKLMDPYVLYIVSTEDGSVLHRVETEINDYEANRFVLGRDKVYYYSWDTKRVKTIDFSGNSSELANGSITDSIGSYYFVVSPDESQIAWVETPDGYSVSQLFVVNTETWGKKLIYEEHFDTAEYIRPISWTQDQQSILFTRQRGELGGYILFDGFWELNRINVTTKVVENNLIPLLSGNSYGTDIFDDRLVVSFTRDKENGPRVAITDINNIDNGEYIVVKNDKGLVGGGSGLFSPDGSKIAFNIARWDSENEYYRTMLYDIKTKEQKIIGDYPDSYFHVAGWINSELFVQSRRGLVQIVDTGGNIVKEFRK